jgi:altronate dehydratase small subunit
MDDDSRLLLLHNDDNVLVARARIRAGERISLGGQSIDIEADVPIGHKLSRQTIRKGDKIIKYGVPIGSATADIPVGHAVHVHNVASDYTPTYTLDTPVQDGGA